MRTMSRVSASSSTSSTAGIQTSSQATDTEQGSAGTSSKHLERLRAPPPRRPRVLVPAGLASNERSCYLLPMDAGRKADGRVERGERTRRQILDAAVDIASVEGLEGLS